MGAMTLIGASERQTRQFVRSVPDFAWKIGRPGRAVCVALACLVTISCGLEARPVEPLQHDQADVSDGQRFADPAAEADADMALAEVVGAGALDPDTLRAISRRAVHDITTNHRGFLPSIAAVSACYDELAEGDFEARLYCLQLDSVAWFVESTAPPAWQELDAASNDFFTNERFSERRWREVPPFIDTPEARLQKRALLDVLDAAASAAISDYIETIAQAATEGEALATPSPQASKPTP